MRTGAQVQEIAPRTRISRALQITGRDKAIFRVIGRGQVASLEQLRLEFWQNERGELARLETVRYRLAQLVGSGYLETGYTSVRHPKEQVYGLTRQGAPFLTPLERERIFLGLPKSNEMRQQLDAQDTRRRLSEAVATIGQRVLDWKNERELRSESFQARCRIAREQGFTLQEVAMEELPDARALVEDENGQTHELDIEIDGAYYGKMLREKLARFKERGRPLVWATVGSRRAIRLRNEVAQAGADNITVLELK